MLYIPYLVFDFQNQHIQLIKMHNYLIEALTGSSGNILALPLKLYITIKIAITQFLFSRLVLNFYPAAEQYLVVLTKIIITGLFCWLLYLIFKKRQVFTLNFIKKHQTLFSFLVLFIGGLLAKTLFSPYDQYRHYFFLFTMLSIIVSYGLYCLLKSKKVALKVISLLFIIFYFATNIFMFSKGIKQGPNFNYQKEGKYIHYQTDHVALDQLSKKLAGELNKLNTDFKIVGIASDNYIVDLEMINYHLRYYSKNKNLLNEQSKNIIYLGLADDFSKVDQSNFTFIDVESAKPLGAAVEINN